MSIPQNVFSFRGQNYTFLGKSQNVLSRKYGQISFLIIISVPVTPKTGKFLSRYPQSFKHPIGTTNHIVFSHVGYIIPKVYSVEPAILRDWANRVGSERQKAGCLYPEGHTPSRVHPSLPPVQYQWVGCHPAGRPRS